MDRLIFTLIFFRVTGILSDIGTRTSVGDDWAIFQLPLLRERLANALEQQDSFSRKDAWFLGGLSAAVITLHEIRSEWLISSSRLIIKQIELDQYLAELRDPCAHGRSPDDVATIVEAWKLEIEELRVETIRLNGRLDLVTSMICPKRTTRRQRKTIPYFNFPEASDSRKQIPSI